jgi:tRNA threonylcarbamoyladenosine modification (KEOPS) complex  Pcc1 subunit
MTTTRTRKPGLPAGDAPSNMDGLAEREAVELAERANRVTLEARARDAIDTLQGAYDGWAGLTAVQKDAIAKLQVRATIAILRLLLRRLDKA